MPVIICIIIAMFLVLVGWSWNNLGSIEKYKKIIYMIIGFIIVYGITALIYQISKSGINYENQQVMETIQNTLMSVFFTVNGYILLPHLFKKIDQLQNDEISTTTFQKTIIIFIVILAVLIFIESKYLANIQNGILQIGNSLKQ